MQLCPSFFFNDTATTEIYTLSLHDALPIFTLFVTTYVAERQQQAAGGAAAAEGSEAKPISELEISGAEKQQFQKLVDRSEEHTSELQSRQYLVCRLLLAKKKLPSS